MKEQIDDIRAIRSMMEKSSKFLSLSGLSGICAGTITLIGSIIAYIYVFHDFNISYSISWDNTLFLLADAILIFIISVGCSIYFSSGKAKKLKQPLWNKATIRTVYHLLVPLCTGGLLAYIFLVRNDISTAISMTLIFYGLALLNSAKYTYEEVQWLGIAEIILGLTGIILQQYELLLWMVGFGACHILYGIFMYFKYDR